MCLRLPQVKLADLKQLVASWIGKKSCSLADLQSLVGKLQHACKVVCPGRTFLRRMFELLKGRPKRQQMIHLNIAFQSDLMWWHMFLEARNGIGIVQRQMEGPTNVYLCTDASGSWGCEAWAGSLWLKLAWPKGKVKEWPIAVKEIVPIVLAGLLRGKRWHGKLVLAHCDNLAVVQVINVGYCKDLNLMQHVQSLFLITAHFEFILKAAHIPGKQNIAADAIARNNLVLFHSQIPKANSQPTRIPQAVESMVIHQQLDWLSQSWSQLFSSWSCSLDQKGLHFRGTQIPGIQ